ADLRAKLVQVRQVVFPQADEHLVRNAPEIERSRRVLITYVKARLFQTTTNCGWRAVLNQVTELPQELCSTRACCLIRTPQGEDFFELVEDEHRRGQPAVGQPEVSLLVMEIFPECLS